jgi:aspartyl protease family protein
MNSGENANLIYGLLVLLLVGSSFFARRLPLKQTLKYALGWIAIFGIGFVLVSFRHEGAALWQRVTSSISPEQPRMTGTAARIGMGEDGHFHANTQINGHSVKFLIDSGATTSTLSRASAEAAGVTIDDTGFPVIVDTANGSISMHRARAETLIIGGISRKDVSFLVSETDDELNLLGMNFLSSLKSWRVEGDEMIFEP